MNGVEMHSQRQALGPQFGPLEAMPGPPFPSPPSSPSSAMVQPPLLEEDNEPGVSGFSGQGLNALSNEADSRHRLLNLTPTPRWERPPPAGGPGKWGAGYALSPAVDVWTERVRCASPSKTASVVGVVGATSAGKSWLVGKLLDEVSAKPSQLEEQYDGVTLQSMTSDINIYPDADMSTYYVDFEGTYGTQPLQLDSTGYGNVMERCADMRAWEAKRRQSLRECYQPAVAYLLCNIVIFVTREKLVCSRSIEECEHFAQAANGRVVSALPPSLILVQNCCRPSEGLFDTARCTEAFRRTHSYSESSEWRSYFRTVDCFCIPDEYLVDKRSGFDGEEVCRQVIDSLKLTIRRRVQEDIAFRLQRQVYLSQVQWFSVVSALCRIVNDNDMVEMESLYMHVGATTGGLAELKSILMSLMLTRHERDEPAMVKELIHTALSLIARFVVRRDLETTELDQVISYVRGLFPCGAVSGENVECCDGSGRQVTCGQTRMIHGEMHRSSMLVRTRDVDWLQSLSEWLRGGIIHAWHGDFTCKASFREFDDSNVLAAALEDLIEAYKLERCLEGLAQQVGSPWVLRAYASLRGSTLPLKRDTTSMCSICMAPGSGPSFFGKWWAPSDGKHMPVCEHCFGVLTKHDLCGSVRPVDTVMDQKCDVCSPRDPWSGLRRAGKEHRQSDHRLAPCKCSICIRCAEAAIQDEYPCCPLCAQPLRCVVDERALVKSSWPAAVRRTGSGGGRSCGTCVSRK